MVPPTYVTLIRWMITPSYKIVTVTTLNDRVHYSFWFGRN